jgi:hypothetical protein
MSTGQEQQNQVALDSTLTAFPMGIIAASKDTFCQVKMEALALVLLIETSSCKKRYIVTKNVSLPAGPSQQQKLLQLG